MKKISKILAIIVILGMLVSTRFYLYLLQQPKPVVEQPQPKVYTYKDLLKVDSPRVTLGKVEVSGMARGNWYFEASFPVEVVDADGTSLGKGPVQAKEDWMTTNYVPFQGTVTFSTPHS